MMAIGRIIASVFALSLAATGLCRADVNIEEQTPRNISYPVFPPAPAM
jgi:hypothetical protein